VTGTCHIRLSVIQRSRGNSALARFAYQACAAFDDGVRQADYRSFSPYHRGTVILLPTDAPPEIANQYNLFEAAAFRESRWDAQDGRAIDFLLPRALDDDLLLPVAAFALAPFAETGMVARIDVESPPASDSVRNPHAHAWLSQRVLEPDGFGLKCRAWNTLFRRDGGRYVRAIIAGRISLAAALVGVAAYVDPRRHDEVGTSAPEMRVPSKFWRMRERGQAVAKIDQLSDRRKSRSAGSAISKALDLKAEEVPLSGLAVRNAVAQCLNVEQLQARVDLVIAKAVAEGIANDSVIVTGHPEVELMFPQSSMQFNGWSFQLLGQLEPQQAEFVSRLARALEWPALVLEGDSTLANEILLAAAPLGLTAINRHADDETLRKIHTHHHGLLLDQIANHDPLAVVENILARHRTAQPQASHVAVKASLLKLAVSGDDSPGLEQIPEPPLAQPDDETQRGNAQLVKNSFARSKRELDDLEQWLEQRAKSSSPSAKHPASQLAPVERLARPQR